MAEAKVFALFSERLPIYANSVFLDFKIAGIVEFLAMREHPIIPIMLGDAKLAQDVAHEMLDENIYVIGFSYPVVPKGEDRIIVQISASHSIRNINSAKSTC